MSKNNIDIGKNNIVFSKNNIDIGRNNIVFGSNIKDFFDNIEQYKQKLESLINTNFHIIKQPSILLQT